MRGHRLYDLVRRHCGTTRRFTVLGFIRRPLETIQLQGSTASNVDGVLPVFSILQAACSIPADQQSHRDLI
jgi:hypothetical protein